MPEGESLGNAFVEISARNEQLKTGLEESGALTKAALTKMESQTSVAMRGMSGTSESEIRKTGHAFSMMSSMVGSELGGIGRGISIVASSLYAWPVAAAAAGAALIGWLVKSAKETEKLRKETERLTIVYDLQAESARKIAEGSEGQRAAFKEIEKMTGNVKIAEEAWNIIRDLTIAGLYSEKEAIALVTKSKEGLKAATMGFLSKEEQEEIDVIDAVTNSIQYKREELEKLRTAAGLKPGEEKPPGVFGIQACSVVRVMEAEENLKNLEKDYEDLGGAERKRDVERLAEMRHSAKAQADYQKERTEAAENYADTTLVLEDGAYVTAKDYSERKAKADEFAINNTLRLQKEAEEEERELQEMLQSIRAIEDAQRIKAAEEIKEISTRALGSEREQRMRDYHDEVDRIENKKRAHREMLDDKLAKSRENVERMRALQYELMSPRDIWRAAVTGEFRIKAAERAYEREERELRKDNNRILKELDASIKSLRDKVDALSQGD
jgi:hypothetical protein